MLFKILQGKKFVRQIEKESPERGRKFLAIAFSVSSAFRLKKKAPRGDGNIVLIFQRTKKV